MPAPAAPTISAAATRYQRSGRTGRLRRIPARTASAEASAIATITEPFATAESTASTYTAVASSISTKKKIDPREIGSTAVARRRRIRQPLSACWSPSANEVLCAAAQDRAPGDPGRRDLRWQAGDGFSTERCAV